jgi:NTP pyrophosphatase (non-canonical NTP hydrolase)
MGFDPAEVAERARQFAAERDWEQFHSLKNLAMALTGEVGELVEIIQWLSDEEVRELLLFERGFLAVNGEALIVRTAQKRDAVADTYSDSFVGRSIDVTDGQRGYFAWHYSERIMNGKSAFDSKPA